MKGRKGTEFCHCRHVFCSSLHGTPKPTKPPLTNVSGGGHGMDEKVLLQPDLTGWSASEMKSSGHRHGTFRGQGAAWLPWFGRNGKMESIDAGGLTPDQGQGTAEESQRFRAASITKSASRSPSDDGRRRASETR